MANLPSDQWAAGSAYELYMGRWSRELARVFLEALRPRPGAAWLEVGCGTGALTTAIRERAAPASLVACDPSESFVAYAKRALAGAPVSFAVATAEAPPRREGGFDYIVSGLVLNFVPKPGLALAAFHERASAGGTVAAYVWDYAGEMEFLRYFWDAVVALDPGAAELDEGRRFPDLQPPLLVERFERAGFGQVRGEWLEIATEFADFDDYWAPFLGGTGPAPAYVAALDAERRERLRERLDARLPRANGGRIALRARAALVLGVKAPA